MKHFINLLVILILTGFAVGIAYLQVLHPKDVWFLAYIPLCGFMLLWGFKLESGKTVTPESMIQEIATHLGKTIPETLEHIKKFNEDLDNLKAKE